MRGAGSRAALPLQDKSIEMKAIIKSLLAGTDYRVIRRADMNRFQAIEECMRGLAARAYRPRMIIDGGAHLGEFALLARKRFPDAEGFHLFEPQQACLEPLRKLCASERFILHECALSSRTGTLRFLRTDQPNTGAHVVDDEAVATEVDARTLDEVLESKLDRDHRALLKLDLQGHELDALRGGAKSLRSIEVVLTEVSFYVQSRVPMVAEVIAFMSGVGFVLYDIAALSGRPRDNRLREGDLVFVRQDSQLLEDRRWE
jgi:FkbM family methyltransferase